MRIFQSSRMRASLLVSLLVSMTSCLVQAQRFPAYKDLHDFGGTVTNANGKTGPDGANPQTAVAFDSAGNVYGTSPSGGANGGNSGIVWEVKTDGTYIDLHDFGGTVVNADGKSGPDGAEPTCSVVLDANGNMFGTTVNGGSNSAGIVWEITKSGTYLDLHDFGGTIISGQNQPVADGIHPHSNVTLDGFGNIFGTASGGGSYGSGILWELSTTGTYTDLHDFGAKNIDGGELLGSIAFDSAGDIIGTTVYGGAHNVGIVWMVTKSGAFQHLHDFGGTITNADGKTGPDGNIPQSGVVFDASGNMYGTTPTGGANNSGIVWEITQSGTYLDLHDFGGMVTNATGTIGPDGAHPYSVVTLGADGNLYGSTSIGGPNDQGNGNNGAGMVWEITASGTYIDVFDVGGAVPHPGFGLPGAVVFDANGNLFATSIFGGANYSGTLWELGVLSVSSISVSPGSVIGGNSSTGTITLNGTALAGGALVTLSSNSPSVSVPPTATVSALTKTATFAITTSAVGALTAATITASMAGVSQSASLAVTPATLGSFTISPTSVVGGNSSIGTVTLSGPAPAGGTTITISSGSANIITPLPVLIPVGMTSATFGIQTVQVTSVTSASISAQLAGTTLKASLTINPLALVSLGLKPPIVTGGNSLTAIVTLNGPAGTEGVSVNLSSTNERLVPVPAAVQIASGQTTGAVSIATPAVMSGIIVRIDASFAARTQSATLSISPPVLQSVSLNPGSLTGGSTSTGTVTLTGPAPGTGFVINLASSLSAATVPANVTIATGKTSATFAIKTSVVSTITKPAISATLGSWTESTTLSINPPVLQSMVFSPATVVGLTPGKGTVMLTGAAPAGGIKIELSSNNGAAMVPAIVTVLAGHTLATFTVKTFSVANQTAVTITGTQGSISQTATLTVNPPILKSLTLSPTTVVGGKSSTGTVTLGTPAPSGGISVNLASGSGKASVPKSVTVAGGSTSAKFTITTTAVTAPTKSAISATLGFVTQIANLTISK